MLFIRVQYENHVIVIQIFINGVSFFRWYYEVGIGIPRDFQHAHHFYCKAAKKGNHKEAQDRVNLLEGMVKHQKNEKRRTLAQEKRRTSNANILNHNESKSNSKSKDSQCAIM